ncbi:MAG TPA: Lrp/AsnC family transcriptional regulator [Armatimonadota bacterium]|nr:Lrp/AsnC family transcriptional regulator [Armatimonadota bacterium]
MLELAECPPSLMEFADPINARILEVSEDDIQGFHEDPIGEIARQSGLAVSLVIERLQTMLAAGTIRRIRQTLTSINLAQGGLVAWQIPEEKLHAAFDFLFQQDPFSGHAVIRSTDAITPGSGYRLWTTLKVPQGYSIVRHCEILAAEIGAEQFRLMPAKRVFALGVGHIRRQGLTPGSKSDALAEARETDYVKLNPLEWQVLMALKRELDIDEIGPMLWERRARNAEIPLNTFLAVAHDLNARRVIGRFSTFLEHVKPSQTGQRLTRCNGLFHWAIPAGREIEAGCEIGRHHILTHCYWRDAGPEFRNVNIMAVAHGSEKQNVLAHKAAIDDHLQSIGMPVLYSNVFWGGRSEIKPSEICPEAYGDWIRSRDISAWTSSARG